jgi:DNA-binding SARP family transcriptional activator
VGDTRYAVDLLGGFALRRDDEPQDLPPAAQRLVACLALAPRRFRHRTSLACALRPEASHEHALGSLRSVLWRLSRGHDGLLEVTADGVRLCPDVAVDVDALERVLGQSGATAAPALSARDLPDADLLPAWEEEWLVAERARMRQLWLHALEVLGGRLCQERRYGLALAAALRVLAADPLRESAHRLVIDVHMAEGNVVEAMRQLDSCRRVLREELGIEPTPRLLHAYVPARRAGDVATPALSTAHRTG